MEVCVLALTVRHHESTRECMRVHRHAFVVLASPTKGAQQVRTSLPKHTWEMHIIAMWSTKGRNYLNACNKNWLKELAKENLEAKWEINYIRYDPYPLAPSKLLALKSKETSQRPPSLNPTRPSR